MQLRLVSLAANSLLLPTFRGSVPWVEMYSYALALDCTGALVWRISPVH